MQQPKLNILLVDDDSIYLYITKKMLASTGLAGDVAIATNGQEALQYIRDVVRCAGTLPDVILLDLNMPVMDGWQFLKEYEALKTSLLKHINIFVVSSSSDTVDINRTNQYNTIKGYLVKPVLREQYVRVLTSVAACL